MNFSQFPQRMQDDLVTIRTRWEHSEYKVLYQSWIETEFCFKVLLEDQQGRYHLHNYHPELDRNKTSYEGYPHWAGWKVNIDHYAIKDSQVIVDWLVNSSLTQDDICDIIQ